VAARDAMAVDTTGEATGTPARGPRCFASRYRRWILAATAIVVPLVAILGFDVARFLSVGGFVASSSDYEVGRRVLTDELQGGTPNFVVLVTVNGAEPRMSAVDGDEVRATGVALTNELAGQPGVLRAFSYWTLGQPSPLRSDDGTKALVLGLIAGDDDTVRDTTDRLSPLFTRRKACSSSVVQSSPKGKRSSESEGIKHSTPSTRAGYSAEPCVFDEELRGQRAPSFQEATVSTRKAVP